MEDKSILQKIIARTFSGLSDRLEFGVKIIKMLKQIADDGQLNSSDLVKNAIAQEDEDEIATTDNSEHPRNKGIEA